MITPLQEVSTYNFIELQQFYRNSNKNYKYYS